MKITQKQLCERLSIFLDEAVDSVDGAYEGCDENLTYRTKLSREELAKFDLHTPTE